MTDAYSNDSRDIEPEDIAVAGDRSGLTTGSLARAAGRLVRDPVLVVPFALVAALLTGIDALRRRDPIPAVEWASTTRTIHVEYPLYPAPRSGTIRPLSALIDLELPYLLWAAGLELLAVGAIAIAGVVVTRRALAASARVDADLSTAHRDRFGAYLGFVICVDLAGRVLDGIDAFQDMGLVLGLPVLIALAAIYIRLMLVPVVLVAGSSLPSAIRRSNRLARGSGWSLLGLILVIGLGTWLLASVPVVGTFLTGLLIAPLQAVTLVVVFERVSAAEDGDPGAVA